MENKNSYISLNWLSAFLISIITFVITIFILPLWVTNPVVNPNLFILEKSMQSAWPERLEQISYLVMLIVPFLLIVIFQKLLLSFTEKIEIDDRQSTILSLVIQSVFLSLVIYCWLIQRNVLVSYFNDTLLFLAIILMVFYKYRSHFQIREKYLFKYLPVILVFFFTAWAILPGFYRTSHLDNAPDYTNLFVIDYHMRFPMDEAAAIINGRVPIVDFFPQYANLIPILLAPFFKLFGFSATYFSLSSVLLTFVALFSVFLALAKITNSTWKACFFYLPIIFVGFQPLGKSDPDGSKYFLPSYYGSMPDRYFGPLLLFYLLILTLQKNKKRTVFGSFFVATLVLINNLDFGLPAFGALFLALTFSYFKNNLDLRKNFLPFIIPAISAVITSLIFFILLLTILAKGSFPDFENLIIFQKLFALTGFFMLPISEVFAFNLIVYLTYLACLYLGIAGCLKRDPQKLIFEAMIYVSIFGLGSAFYYVGRSHAHTLAFLFPTWGLSLGLLFYYVSDLYQNKTNRQLLIVPFYLIMFHLAICWSSIITLSNPFLQIKRIFTQQSEKPLANYLYQIKDNLSPGEKTAIISSQPHVIANTLGVDNLFPFNHIESLILVEQADLFFRILEKNSVTKFFAPTSIEFEKLYNAHGFFSAKMIDTTLYLWEKKSEKSKSR
jgi:hypothetical protein